MNNLFVTLVLTTITGTIFYLIVLVFRQIWSRNDIKILRIQMQITQWAFLLPCVYVILYLREQVHVRRVMDGIVINLFYNTPTIRMIGAALACAWVVLFLVVLVNKLDVRINWMRLFKGNIPEEDVETQVLFDEICSRFGITGKVSLYRNDMLNMPCITYSRCNHGFAVVLPLECYKKNETTVILYHELSHYLNGDFYIGTISCIVSLLHVFNPFVPKILKQMNLVCEEYCDRRACIEGAELFNEKEYFSTILKLLEEEKRERYNLFMLADTISDYERRVQCMKRYHEHGDIKKGIALILLVCFLLGSNIISLVSGFGMTKGYKEAIEATDNRVVDSKVTMDTTDELETMSNEKVLEEFTKVCDLNLDNTIMMSKDDIELIGDCIYIDWKLVPGKTGMVSDLLKKTGDSISIMTIGDSDDISYQMGIMDSKKFMRYVEGTGHLSYEFPITANNKYCFFVTNLDNSVELKIRGTVIK